MSIGETVSGSSDHRWQALQFSGTSRAFKALIMLCFDAVVLYVASVGVGRALNAGEWVAAPSLTLLLVLASLGLYAAAGLYRLNDRPPIPTQALRIPLCLIGIAVLLAAAGVMLPGTTGIGTGAVAAWALSSAAGSSVARWGWYAYGRRRSAPVERPAFIVGSTADVRRALSASAAGTGEIATPVGVFLTDGTPALPHIAGLPVLGRLGEVPSAVVDSGIDTLLAVADSRQQVAQEYILKTIAPLDIDCYLLLPDLPMAAIPDTDTGFRGIRALRVQSRPMSEFGKLGKRMLDLLGGSLLLAATAPIFGAAALAIKLESRGPCFFKQRRHGYNDHLVTVYKFRTMYHEASDPKAVRATQRDDPRVTRVGRILRRTSLDELPQLINVLQGRMSLVGPRPHAPESKAGDWYFRDAVNRYPCRHRVKPGLTGAAQVSGWRGPTETLDKLEQRVSYDLWYIHNWSLLLDIKILLKTPFALVGANTF